MYGKPISVLLIEGSLLAGMAKDMSDPGVEAGGDSTQGCWAILVFNGKAYHDQLACTHSKTGRNLGLPRHS